MVNHLLCIDERARVRECVFVCVCMSVCVCVIMKVFVLCVAD